MAAKTQYITTKYGTKINVTGLSPEQVTRVRKISEDNGAYGAKGAALADAFRKQVAKTPVATTTTDVATGASPVPQNTSANQSASAAAGGTITSNNVDPGKIDLTGAPVVGGEDIGKLAGQAADANYNYITRNYATQKKQEMDAAKQELAQRGIPLDPSPDSLYGRTLAQIDQKYQALDDQANNQAIVARDSSLTATTGVQKTSHDAFLSGIQARSDAELKAAGLSDNMIIELRKIAATKKIAANQNKTDIQRTQIASRRPGGGTENSDGIIYVG